MVGRRFRCPGSGPAGAFTTVALPTGVLRVVEFIELKSYPLASAHCAGASTASSPRPGTGELRCASAPRRAGWNEPMPLR